ncbi:hypothetical protein SLS54_005000 [Diplodia seriata]
MLPSGRIRYLVQFTDALDGEYEWRDEIETGAYLRMQFFRGQYDQQNNMNPATVEDPEATKEEKEQKEKEKREKEKQEKEKKEKAKSAAKTTLPSHTKMQNAIQQAAKQERERKAKEKEEKEKRDKEELEKKKKKVAEMRDAAKKASDPTLKPHSGRPQSVAPPSFVSQSAVPPRAAPQGNRPLTALPSRFLQPTAAAAQRTRPQSAVPSVPRSQSTVPVQTAHQQGATSSQTVVVTPGVSGLVTAGQGQRNPRQSVLGQGGAPDPDDSSEPSSSSDGSDISEDLDQLGDGGVSDVEKSDEISDDSFEEEEDEDEDDEDRDLRTQAILQISQSQQLQQPSQSQQVVVPSVSSPKSLNKYMEWLPHGFLPLLSRTYDDCVKTHGALNQSKKMDFALVGCRILACIPKELLEAIMDGNVPLLRKELRDNRPNDHLTRFLQSWDKRATVHPSIYQRSLVHERTKEAPTPTELRRVLANLKLYGRKGRGPMERTIDSMVGKWGKDQLRYVPDVEYHQRELLKAKTAAEKNDWMKKKQSAANRQTAFFKKIDEFCANADKRFKKLQPAMLTKPFQTPWRYIGFAKNAYERNTSQHNKHSSSSALMMLVEATTMYTLNLPAKSFLGPYRMEWSVVSYINTNDEATPSEIILAIISEAYWSSGIGLGIEDSGKNNDVSDFDGKWDSFVIWTMAHPTYHDNMREQNSLIEAKRQRRFVAEQESAREKAQAQGGAEGLEREIQRQELITKIGAARLTISTFEKVHSILDEVVKKAKGSRKQ